MKAIDEILMDASKQIMELHNLDVVVYYKIKNYTSVQLIKQIVATTMGVTVKDIDGKCRKREIATARHLVWYIMYHNCGFSKNNIAKIVGRNHTSVLYSLQQIDNYLSVEDPLIVSKYNSLKKFFQNEA